MSFLPDELIMDETVDTRSMRPEDDFASPADPSIPRRNPNQATDDSAGDSYYGAQPRQQHNMPHRDLEADQFNPQQNLPHTFSQGKHHDYPSTGRQEYEMVGDIPQYDANLRGGNSPVITPEEGEDTADEEEFSDELLNAAGLTREQAGKDFQTQDALSAAVRMLDQRFINQGQQSIQSRPADSVQDIVPDSDEWEMPEPDGNEGWDDDTKKLVTAMGTQFKSMLAKRDEQIQAQQNLLTKQIDASRVSEDRRKLHEFDSMVNSLPDEYVPILGRGNAHDLERHGMHFNNRYHLEKTMLALQEGSRLSGRSEIPQEELMIRSLSVAFPEAQKMQTRIQEDVVDQVHRRQQMMTQRPTQRHQPAMSPVAKAGQTAEDWYRKHNMDNMDDYEF